MPFHSEVHVAPGLLVSMPQLLDPNFSRSVVLMIEHGDNGSFGLVLNRPSKVTVGELMTALHLPWGGNPRDIVGEGGPVMQTSAWIIHEAATVACAPDLESALRDGEPLSLGKGLVVSSSTDTLKEFAEQPPERARFFLGYSGWGPGQLAAEMTQGSWLHAPVEPRLIFDLPADEVWGACFRAIGVDPEAVIPSRGVH